VSFFGGGSDIGWHYRKYGGAVLSTTIDKYVYISAHPLVNDDSILLKYSKIEYENFARDIKHPIVRTILENRNLKGIDIGVTADVPAGTGMGSSSAFTVGLLNLLNAYEFRSASMDEVAREDCHVDIDLLQEPIGKQDQYASTFGGLNLIQFHPNEEVEVVPIFITGENRNYLEESLILVRIGDTRSASNLLAKQKQETADDEKKHEYLQKMSKMAVDEAALLNTNPEKLGLKLTEAWKLKKQSAPSVTNGLVEEFLDYAIQNGANGGKLLGAGQAGFALIHVDVEKKRKFLNNISGSSIVPFRFEQSGSRIIYDK
jgi:D-glycero-alpha-D-manno-heptose-7-phosphate kinase